MGKPKPKKEKSAKKGAKVEEEREGNPDYHNGHAFFKLPNGDSYDGDFCAHKCGLIWREGFGVYTTADGQIYKGTWKDDHLAEATEVIIEYPSGAQYNGSLVNSQYSGNGTYTFENKMNISCKFNQNKPAGNVTLIDSAGRLWNGEAKAEEAILLPENLFYCEIPDHLGFGELKHPQKPEVDSKKEDVKSISSSEGQKVLTDRDLEKIVFAKSTKTVNDVDFWESKWLKKYLAFKEKKKRILDIVRTEGASALNLQDRKWYKKFEVFKSTARRKDDKAAQEKLNSQMGMLLMFWFYSQEYKNSCPALKIFFPRTSADLDEDEKAALSLLISKEEESGEDP